MSFYAKFVGTRPNVRAAIKQLDTTFPPQIKTTLINFVDAGKDTDPNWKTTAIHIEAQGHYDATHAYSNIEKLKLDVLPLAPFAFDEPENAVAAPASVAAVAAPASVAAVAAPASVAAVAAPASVAAVAAPASVAAASATDSAPENTATDSAAPAPKVADDAVAAPQVAATNAEQTNAT